ncbi:hypothetical protein AXX17_AT1G52580 [Arabidopsis thaliana]|uniref:Uncharacterized protein n=1 Tax=Arabidopsis thaliana TaxID=3702 RepID=A0A178WE20_ARATH|nr:hypothetical protein AXX17_AT1G52580 [Arabidopsis thaliana]
MDSIISTALDEICSQGNTGIPLVTLWSRLSPLSSSIKTHVWRNLLTIPQLQFKTKKNTVYGSSDTSIQQLEDALRLDLRIVANENLQAYFVGLYDTQSNNTTIPAIQRRVLERLAIARDNGDAQNLLAKEFGIDGRNFFYSVKQLESRGLIVRQPAIVRTKEVDSKTTSCITTNMIYLTRYAKPMGSQQRFEICKEDSVSEHETTAAGEDTLINDFLPAMQEVCDKLEKANDKVLVISDIKQDLGYTGSDIRHRAWRSVCRRLLDSHVVEEFDAMVNNKAESHKKTRVFRLWTSRHARSESSDKFPDKAENIRGEDHDSSTPHGTDGLAKTKTTMEHSTVVSDADFSTTPASVTDSERNSGAKRRKVPTRRNLQESFNEIGQKVVNAAKGSPDLLKSAKSKVQQPHATIENSRREQRILERLKEEKFVLRVEFHKWLLTFEKGRSPKVDRKTIYRILDRLQDKGLCKCVGIRVPNVNDCDRSRCSVIVLHPSVQRLTRDIGNEIHDRIRSFELGFRSQRSSKRESDKTVPVLNDVQRAMRASKSGAMRGKGVVLAKMVRVKLLHCFLWDYFSSLPGWDSASSSIHDHISKNLFSLKDAFRAMPLQLFLQVVGSTQKADDIMKKYKQVMRLSELPNEEYKLLMDTRVIGILSMLIDILRRFKLIQMVSDRLRREKIEKYANLTHAMELNPYIEEPVFVAAKSDVTSLDLRPRIRHDFVLSNRDAVDEYWLTLEYCYAASDHEAAKQAFPGSVSQEVFGVRSWASDHVMTAEQRAKLLQCIDEKAKLSFKECEKFAKDLNLTIEQVMHVYHAKHGRRVKSNSKDKNKAVENSPSSSKKRKRASLVKTKGEGVKSIIVDGQKVLNSDAIDASNSESFQDSLQDDQTPIQMHRQEHAEISNLTEAEPQCSNIINRHASSKTRSLPSQRFTWTDEADRKLLSKYARHRAALGAKFHGVNWASVQELPAPPLPCKRRIQTMMRNDKVRKAVMRLCNLLSERYAKHLKTESDSVEHRKDEGKWDDFNEKSISQAFNNVLELKKMGKLMPSQRTRPEIHTEDIQTVSIDQVKDTSRLHQILKHVDEKDNGCIQVQESLVVSTAVELLKLVFLSMPTAPSMPNLLEDTLRRYSEGDLFTAYSYLRDKKFLVGGSDGQPFVLSQNFLHSISKSPFPVNTGKRAAKFSSWLVEHERDLMDEGVTLTSLLQCGDVLKLFSLVASGELSLSVSLPEEGVGEPEHRRGLKRRADDVEESELDSAKKFKLLGEGEINVRKEKGFPGLAVSVRRVTIPIANAIELFKDDDSWSGELHFMSGETNNGCGSDDMKELLDSKDATVIPGSLVDSPWQAVASVASCIMSGSAEEQQSLFSPEVFEAVSNALHKAGDQGLSIEEVHFLINIPSQETCDCIVEVLQTFGVALKVNGYDNFRLVHSLYRSKYFLTLEDGGTTQNGQQSQPANYVEKALEEHRSNDVVTSDYSTSQDKQVHVSENSVHKVTILNIPEMAETSGLQEGSTKAPSVTFGTSIEGETKESTSVKSQPMAIFPWINANGSVNKVVFDGLVRRVLGTVMQNPGIPEEEIINQMDVLNPQSCRKLLELMTLDGYMKLREMVQTKFSGPPSLLTGLLFTGHRKTELISRKHFFANSKGLFAL